MFHKQEAAGSSPASPTYLVAEAQLVERPPETRGVAGSSPAGHISTGSVAQAELPALTRARCRFDSCRGHHSEGLPSARYPVSKTGGSQGLGGSTPSPSSPSGGMAELARQRVASAGGESRSQVRILLPPSPPRSSAEKSSGFRPHARPFESGRGVHVHDATSFNGRTTGCYPENAGSTPAVAASSSYPRSSSGRGRRSLTPEARVRFPLGVLTRTLSDASGICGPVVSRVRRVRFPSRALLAVAQWMSSALLPRAMGVRLLPARLRRKASSEPAGCEPVKQGAIPWRRLME